MTRKQVLKLAKENNYILHDVKTFFTSDSYIISIIEVFKPKYLLFNEHAYIIGFGKNLYEIASYMKGEV